MAIRDSKKTKMTPATAILSRRKRRSQGACQPVALFRWFVPLSASVHGANLIPSVRRTGRSIVPNRRVDDAVQNVHQRIDDDDDRRVNHEAALDERVVPLLDGADEQHGPCPDG